MLRGLAGARQRNVRTPLDTQTVAAVYRELLRRSPDSEEIAQQLRHAADVRELLHAVLSSDEYARLRARLQGGEDAEVHANVWTAGLARFSPPPGTVSDDGVVEVGREGYLFIRGGTNDARRQFSGECELPEDWAAGWTDAVRARADAAKAVGAQTAWLAVPDKLALGAELLVDPPQEGMRPVRRLIEELGVPLLYPVAALKRLGPEAYLRADSHLTLEGNRAIAHELLAELGADGLPEIDALALEEQLRIGDLGAHFQPALAEVIRVSKRSLGALTEDNYVAIEAAGGHVGTRRVCVNREASDQRRVVVFGDSCAIATHRHQGIAWWLSWVFREVHFIWLPFGWDQIYLNAIRPDIVVCQGVERFCLRTPSPDSDTARMAAEMLSGSGG